MPSGSAPGPGSGTCADASSYAASRRLSILSSAPVSVRKFACSPRLHPYLRSATCSNSAREVQPVPCKEHFPEPGRTLPGPNPGTVRKPARALSRAHTPNQVLALPGSCPDHARPRLKALPKSSPEPCPRIQPGGAPQALAETCHVQPGIQSLSPARARCRAQALPETPPRHSPAPSPALAMSGTMPGHDPGHAMPSQNPALALSGTRTGPSPSPVRPLPRPCPDHAWARPGILTQTLPGFPARTLPVPGPGPAPVRSGTMPASPSEFPGRSTVKVPARREASPCPACVPA